MRYPEKWSIGKLARNFSRLTTAGLSSLTNAIPGAS
jgi:hypothetical protein